jgi:NADP-dependent alcohol dehydrogenase
MNNFVYRNPVKILFGKGMIASLGKEILQDSRVFFLYGGGSIKSNGVYDQVIQSLAGFSVTEFGGIPANPTLDKCMDALATLREKACSFILAVGGGSVIDAAKFVALSYYYSATSSPWDMMQDNTKAPAQALPIGTVLTLPGTGSEMNSGFVISRTDTREKLTCGAFAAFPQFSILDPQTTYSLPPRQLRNGLVDTFVHVAEQYVTKPSGSLLQDRQAEAILSTIVDIADDVLTKADDYDSRANLMWCAAQALNGLINRGGVMDWSTHHIGHRLTALYNLDHAATLAIVLPGVWAYEQSNKRDKLVQYGKRIWKLDGSAERIAADAILATERFFKRIGIGVRFSDYGIDGNAAALAIKTSYEVDDKPVMLGENRDISADTISTILSLRA